MQALKFNSFPTSWDIKPQAGISRDIRTAYPEPIDGDSFSFLEAVKKALAKRDAAGSPDIDAVKAEAKVEIIKKRPETVVPTPRYSQPIILETHKEKAKRIKNELIISGASVYGLLKAESRILPKIIHANETIMAVIYGRQQSSSIMVVATDKRIISLDKKPMVLLMDEFSYEVVAGLEFEIHTLFASLILHTPVKKYDIRFVNLRCADRFVRYVETQRIKSIRKKEDKTARKGPFAIESPLVLYPRRAANLELDSQKYIDKESEDETYYSPANEHY
jgi:hypothetical protein